MTDLPDPQTTDVPELTPEQARWAKAMLKVMGQSATAPIQSTPSEALEKAREAARLASERVAQAIRAVDKVMGAGGATLRAELENIAGALGKVVGLNSADGINALAQKAEKHTTRILKSVKPPEPTGEGSDPVQPVPVDPQLARSREEAEKERKLEQAELESSQAALNRRRASVERMRSEATTALGSLPPGIATLFQQAEKGLTAAVYFTDPEAIDKAVEASDGPLGEIEKEVARLTQQRAAYLPRLAAAKQAVAGLKSHPNKAPFATEIGVQEGIVTNAETVIAAAHRYNDAVTALNKAITDCAALERRADAGLKYTAILSEREGRVNALANPSGLAPVNTAIQAVKTRLLKAKQHGTAKEYPQATALLDELVKDCIDTAWMSEKAEEYSWKYGAQGNLLSELKGLSIPEAAEAIATFELDYQNCTYEKTNDYNDSCRVLIGLWDRYLKIKADIEQITEAKNELKKLADEIPKFKVLPGADGIEADIKKQQTEHDYAATKIGKTEYVGAKALLVAAIKLWDDIRKKAAAYKLFEDEYKAANTQYETYAAMPGASGAVDKLNTIHDLLSDAKTQAKAGKLEEGRTALLKARQLLPEAHNAVLKAHHVDGVDKAPADPTADDKTQVATLLGTFDTLYNPANTDPNREFGDGSLTKASTKRGEAITARDLATPDYGTAKAKLNAGIRDALQARRDIDEGSAMMSLMQGLQTGMSALADPDDVIKTERDAIGLKGQELQTAMTQTPPDVARAHKLVAETVALVEKAKGLLDAYTKYKALLPTVTPLVGEVKSTDGDAAIPELAQALKDDFDKAKDHALIGNRRYKEALKLLEDVHARVPPLKQMIADYKKAKGYRDSWVKPSDLDPYRNKPIVADELAQMETLRLAMEQKFTDRMYSSAYRLGGEVSMAERPAKEIMAAHDAYVLELGKVEPKLLLLRPLTNPAVATELARIEEVVKQAKAVITRCEGAVPNKCMLIDEAKATLVPLPGQIDTAIALAKEYDLYEPARLTAANALALLDKPEKQNAIGHRIDAIKAVMARAKALADAADYKGAKALVDTVPGLCTTAQDHADAHGDFAGAAGADQEKIRQTADKTVLEQEVTRARGLLLLLRNHPAGTDMAKRLDAIGLGIDKAGTALEGDKLDAARESLTDAFWSLEYTHTIADQHAQFRTLLGEAKQALQDVRSHKHAAVVAPALGMVDFQLGMAEQNAAGDFFQNALSEVAQAAQACKDALASCAAHEAYQVARKKQMDRFDVLSGHPHRYAIEAELKDLRARFGKADDSAAALAHPAAMALLDGIKGTLAVTELRAKMQGGAAPTDKELKDILDQPDGPKALDRIILGLDPATKRKVVHKAFNLRFDVDLKMLTDTEAVENLPESKAPNILKLYDVMSKVPDKYTRDSASMKTIKRVGEDVGTSDFWAVDKSMTLKIGRAEDKNEMVLADPSELPNVDPELRPIGKAAPKFNWTTLHEIAHSIDDRAGYMKSNAGSVDHGAWKSHGGNVTEIAAAAAGEFKYDAKYIEAYLQGGEGSTSYPIPKPQGGIDPDQWERNRIEAVTWCDAIREKKNLWYNDGECKKRAIKGRVYQESYGNDWTSYLYAARSKGVTGYQFRAPGEWFSEIYAAYHTGNLPKSHPACGFLEQFGKPGT